MQKFRTYVVLVLKSYLNVMAFIRAVTVRAEESFFLVIFYLV